MRTALFGAIALATLALPPAAVWAEGNPSASSITNSLLPGPSMTGGTRGIRPLSPAGNPAATPSTRPVAGHYGGSAQPATTQSGQPSGAQPSAPSVNLTVQFATDSAQLTPQAERTLDELGRALTSQQLASYRFRIEGHTDTQGSPDHNQALSAARANAVVDYLATHFNVDRSRLEAVGMGQSHLLIQTRQGINEPRNRRVTVVNLGA